MKFLKYIMFEAMPGVWAKTQEYVFILVCLFVREASAESQKREKSGVFDKKGNGGSEEMLEE